MEAPVEQLKRLARHPLKIMDDLLAAAAAVAAAPDLPWEEKAERLRAKQEACLQEMEATYTAFRRAAAAEEVRLRDVLGEGGRSPLESARRCAERLRGLVQAVRAREDLLQDWEDASAAEFLQTYREAMEWGDRDAVALLEVCGERILQRLGERAHLESFRQMRRQRQARNGTPEERGAVRSLNVLADLRREAEVLYGLPGLRVAARPASPPGGGRPAAGSG
jgi:hypothetical protein